MSEQDLVRNASDTTQVRKAGKKEKFLRREQLADIRALLAFPQCRRFLWRILEQTGMYASAFSSDALLMAHLTGQQNIGRFIVSELEDATPGIMIQLMKDGRRPTEQETEQPEAREEVDGT